MKDLCRRGPKKLIFKNKYSFLNSVFPYQNFRGLMDRTPDFHAGNRGSNPAGGNKLLCFFTKNWFLKCFSCIFAKKRDSHDHFKCIKKHKTTPRNCCFSVITLCSPKKFQHIILTLPRWYIHTSDENHWKS